MSDDTRIHPSREQRPDELDGVQVEQHPERPSRFLARGTPEALRPFIEAGEFPLSSLWAKSYTAYPAPMINGVCRIESVSDREISGAVGDLHCNCLPEDGAP